MAADLAIESTIPGELSHNGSTLFQDDATIALDLRKSAPAIVHLHVCDVDLNGRLDARDAIATVKALRDLNAEGDNLSAKPEVLWRFDVNRDGQLSREDVKEVVSALRQRAHIRANPNDVNQDGLVNVQDVQRIAKAIRHPESVTRDVATDLIVADVNDDGVVNQRDLIQVIHQIAKERARSRSSQ